MTLFDDWLVNRGADYADRLDSQADPICKAVTILLITAYPDICYLPERTDAAAFQQHAVVETPRRFHRLIQVVLRLQTLTVVDHQYRWGWPLLQRFGVGSMHLLMLARWYFETSRQLVPPATGDQPYVLMLEGHVLSIIESIVMPPLQLGTTLTSTDSPPSGQNGHKSQNGHH